MTIKKVKKVKNLKKGDIVLVDVAEQNDAGVFSDRTTTNVLVIVDSIEFKKDNAYILTNGGYEFVYPKDLITFYLGNYSSVKEEADALYEAFNQSEVPVKQINGYIREAEEFMKSMKFMQNHSN